MAGLIPAMGQVVRKQVVENGGPYKAEIVEDTSATRFTFYRPADLDAAVKAEGKLPVILYANGGCRR